MSVPPDPSSELVTLSARLVRLVRSTGAYPATMRVLALLDEHGPLTITTLAHLDRCSQPTMSSSVAQLEADGLVARAGDPGDGRRVVVTPTPAGKAALGLARQGNGALVAERAAAAGITRSQLDTAAAVLRGVLA